MCILFAHNSQIYFFNFFRFVNLSQFLPKTLIVGGCLVSATPPTVFGQSFWNFTNVLAMVCRCAYYLLIILRFFFFNFFRFVNLVSFYLKPYSQWVSRERNSSYSFWPIILKLHRWLGQGLKICILFAHKSEIFFFNFFHFVNLVSFYLKPYSQWVSCERNSSYSFWPVILKRHRCFGHGV